MQAHEFRFGSVKEDRGWYFVEYSPPMENYLFSLLQLTVVEERSLREVAESLESEARLWLRRYPVPLMATAFSANDSVLSLEGIRPLDNLMAWSDPNTKEPILRWEIVPNAALPNTAHNRQALRKLFADVPVKTGAQVQQDVARLVKERKLGWWLVFIWAVVVPLGVAVVEWWSDLLGLAVLVYAFIKAGIEALRLTGHLPKSAAQRAKEAEGLRMRHHHYHCERNPEAFERLKAENFRKAAIERTKAEAATVKGSQSNVDA
jgi:hypothetical protein